MWFSFPFLCTENKSWSCLCKGYLLWVCCCGHAFANFLRIQLSGRVSVTDINAVRFILNLVDITDATVVWKTDIEPMFPLCFLRVCQNLAWGRGMETTWVVGKYIFILTQSRWDVNKTKPNKSSSFTLGEHLSRLLQEQVCRSLCLFLLTSFDKAAF